ncbi:hypothetical protein FSP39_000279 [Pinctada imbricata]|uniref:C2H2-type domain-containing protein n=1 Tax=Pinctada imbricata TaxID=66713 RepID=A0AA88YH88_PINIB|nr:hypothetical protein FSP39_000279 [Pinctada imbricata]
MESSGRNPVPHANNPHHVVQQQPIKSQHLAQHLPQNVRQSPKQSSTPGEARLSSEQDRNFSRHDSPEMSDSNGQRSRRSNSVSKHEPIQNIIGNHSPNDILYLICRLCGQTYGSPYGFRKHFRNQHGFEPHAEHTVVQTISATKTAMRGPPFLPQGEVSMSPHMMHYNHGPPQLTAADDQKHLLMPPMRQIPRAKSASPKSLKNMERLTFTKTQDKPERADQKSEILREESLSKEDTNDLQSKEISVGENSNFSISKQDENVSERRYLECHECGQHFQLNDFGSYKRHCRQHGHRLENPFKAATDPGASVIPTGQPLNLNSDDKSSAALRSTHAAGMKEFRCKFCKELFLAPDLLEEHINNSHPDKPCRFKCLICHFRSHLFYLFKSHMSKMHKLSVPESNNFSCPDLKFAEEMSSEDKNFSTEKESTTASSGSVDLKFIPSTEVTRMSADTAVTSASPDSSSDPVASGSSKTDSISSTSKLAIQINEQGSESKDSSVVTEKSTAVSRQVSQESGSLSDNSQTADENSEFRYMHKKFGSKRKMSIGQSQNSNDSTKSKALKTSLSVDSSTKSPGISHSQRSPSVNSNASIESESSSITDTRSVVDAKENKLSPLTGNDDGSGKYIVKMRYGDAEDSEHMFLQKGEARHQLPFVWDRVTRTKAGKNIKPPKYHS